MKFARSTLFEVRLFTVRMLFLLKSSSQKILLPSSYLH